MYRGIVKTCFCIFFNLGWTLPSFWLPSFGTASPLELRCCVNILRIKFIFYVKGRHTEIFQNIFCDDSQQFPCDKTVYESSSWKSFQRWQTLIKYSETAVGTNNIRNGSTLNSTNTFQRAAKTKKRQQPTCAKFNHSDEELERRTFARKKFTAFRRYRKICVTLFLPIRKKAFRVVKPHFFLYVSLFLFFFINMNESHLPNSYQKTVYGTRNMYL